MKPPARLVVPALHLLLLLESSQGGSSFPRRTGGGSQVHPFLAHRGGGSSSDGEDVTDGIANLSPDPSVELLGETVLWKGAWRSMLQRTVTLPGAKTQEVAFDVVASNHGDESVLVLAWDTRTSTATLIREYHPGPNEWQYGVVAGGYEGKHDSPLDAGRSELEEEARLIGGTWTSLLIPREEDQGGAVTTVSHDKYTTNRFHAFLAVDCDRVEEGKARDDEESIRVVHGVTAAELRHLVRTARLNVPSSYAILLALDALREMGLTPP